MLNFFRNSALACVRNSESKPNSRKVALTSRSAASIPLRVMSNVDEFGKDSLLAAWRSRRNSAELGCWHHLCQFPLKGDSQSSGVSCCKAASERRGGRPPAPPSKGEFHNGLARSRRLLADCRWVNPESPAFEWIGRQGYPVPPLPDVNLGPIDLSPRKPEPSSAV